MSSEITFLDLVRDYVKDKTDLDHYLHNVTNKINYNPTNYITSVLPGSILLVNEGDEDNCFNCKFLCAVTKKVYSYKKYIITACLDSKYEDTIENIAYVDGLIEYCETRVKVYLKKEFNIHDFIKTDRLSVLIQIYKHFEVKNGLTEFLLHVEKEYKKNFEQ